MPAVRLFNSLMKKESFAKNNILPEEKQMEVIRYHFAKIMEALNLNLEDPSLKDTPDRVAYMFVNEVFKGLNPRKKPEVKLFPNDAEYQGIVLHKDINVYSFCEHHFLPFIGVAHVAYLPKESVIGLSKLNRIVEYYSRRPQLQERLTEQIAEELMSILQTRDVAVWIEAEHLCVKIRGVQHHNSKTITSFFGGKFKKEWYRDEFFKKIKSV